MSSADLASRFPNVLEPWTSRIYETLEDPEPAVKLAALSSLTHLVLGGMVKAKGNVAKVAALLVDNEQEITERAALFFRSLAKTGSGSSTRAASAAAGASAANPVYNLLPDCLSKLLENDKLREEQLQAILAVLLAYVKDKQAESLKERLVGRLALGGPREWRTVAWCIGQLGYSEKGMRRIIELTPSYRHALAEQQVFDVFMALAEKARRSTGATKAAAAAVPESGSQLGGVAGDLRTAVEDWVADLQASRQAAVEAAEVEAAEEARRQQQQQQQEDADAAGDASEEADAAVAQQSEDEGDSMQTEAAAGDAAAAAGDGAAAAAAAAEEEGPAAEDDDGAAADQIVLLQSQSSAAAASDDEAEEAAETARRRQQQVEARLQRLSIATGSGSARPSSAAAATARGRAGTRASRSSAAALGAAGKRQPAATARRRGSKAAAGKESESDSSSSSSDDDDHDEGSSSGEDDTAAGDKQPQRVPAAGRGKAAGASSRRVTATAAEGGTKRATRHNSAVTPAEQARFVDFSGSEDDD
uniref:Condensin complex subunit 1 C-terminal domain-containing protein n=1 Tax=Tetradesmus obliquus TaxID=3088 RepID=A0A383VMF6_TETOB